MTWCPDTIISSDLLCLNCLLFLSIKSGQSPSWTPLFTHLSLTSLFSQVSITSIKAHSLLHSLTHPHSVHSSLLWGLQPQETLPLLISLYPPLRHTGYTAPDCPLHPASLTMIADTSSRLPLPSRQCAFQQSISSFFPHYFMECGSASVLCLYKKYIWTPPKTFVCFYRKYPKMIVSGIY